MEPIELIHTNHHFPAVKELHYGMDSAFWILIGANLLLIAIARSTNRTYLRSLFVTAVFNRQLLQNSTEELRFGSLASILLTVVYFNCAALIVSLLFLKGFESVTYLIVAMISVLSLLKLGIIKLTAFLTQSSDGLYEHQLNHLLYYQIAGVVLTPVLIFTHYLPASYSHSISLILGLLVAFFIFIRELQSLFRAIRARVAVLYIILYLCTLELLPLVVIIQAFVSE